jgi:hypothetical protein
MELEEVFDHFRKNHLTILLGDFDVKLGRVDILKQLLGMRAYLRLVLIMVLE